MRFVAPDAVLETVRPVYERALHRRAGTITRPDWFWTRYLGAATRTGTAHHVVVHADDAGAVDGYAHYEVSWNDDAPSLSGGRGRVHEVIAVDDTAELALWGFLLDIDLVRTWSASQRPVDDLVRSALADRRAYAVTAVDDEQWVRLVDVDAALRARTYAPVDSAVTIAVVDDWVATNRGTWRIDARGAARVDGPGDVRAGIAAVSAAYLGGTSWRTLAATGRAEGAADALARADALMAVRPAPWCGSFF